MSPSFSAARAPHPTRPKSRWPALAPAFRSPCSAGYLNIDVGDLQVKLAGALDARGFFDIDPTAPVGFYDIDARVSFTGTATPAELAELFACVEKCCPVLAVFRQPMTVNLSFDQRES